MILLCRQVLSTLFLLWAGVVIGVIITYLQMRKENQRYKKQLSGERLASLTLENKNQELSRRLDFTKAYIRGLKQ
jgi:uncharacterized membrane-anchored protein YhcB (DUF1043 family)